LIETNEKQCAKQFSRIELTDLGISKTFKKIKSEKTSFSNEDGELNIFTFRSKSQFEKQSKPFCFAED
jgi:hypothetical protein